jgi:hypothetical protein
MKRTIVGIITSVGEYRIGEQTPRREVVKAISFNRDGVTLVNKAGGEDANYKVEMDDRNGEPLVGYIPFKDVMAVFITEEKESKNTAEAVPIRE